MTYQIVLSPTAKRLLAEVSDRRIQELIAARISSLVRHPEQQGKPLMGEFSGFRSLRAVGQRYRIIFKVERQEVIVFVVALGIRKEGSKQDVYEIARKLIRARLL